MTLDQVLWECFRHFVHLDHSNAAVHCAIVRYSPITFRLAEELQAMLVRSNDTWRDLDQGGAELLDDVLEHIGRYEEDRGR